MKQVFLLGSFLLGLLAGPLAPGARAQCVATPQLLPAGCAPDQVFRAIDVATGTEVQSLCVGQQVRFELGCGRQVAPSLLYYPVQVTPNINTTSINCTFNSSTNTNLYTPTTAGAVTVAELANPSVAGGTATIFTRNFQVYASPAPTFTLVPCLNNLVQLTITDGSYDQYVVRVGGAVVGPPLAPGAVTTIPAPPGGSVSVAGFHAGNALCTNQSTQLVPALPAPITPILTGLVTSGPLPGSLTFSVDNFSTAYRFDVQVADAAQLGGWRRVALLPPSTAGTITTSTLTLAGQTAGLYRIGRRDVCGTDSAFSVPVPTLELNVSSANSLNTLTWRVGGPVSSYRVLRDGAVLATLPATATSYPDATAVCGVRYTYRLLASAGSGQAFSNEVPVQTVSTLPPPAPLLNASFDLLGRVELTATLPGGAALPAGSTLRFSRQGGGQDLTFAPGPNPTRLRDSTALGSLLAAPPCYAAVVQDICGNSSAASSPTCPSLLAAEAADPEGRSARLSWSAFRGPGSPGQPVSYRVLTLAADGTVLAASAATSALSYLDLAPPTDRQILRYRVEASGAGLPPGTVSYSNVATITRRPVLAVPNAFTPNGDGLNDVLELKGRYLAAFTFVVVDRNGQEVFRATDRGQTWDGTIRGHTPVNAAYVWRFTMTDEAGQPFSQTGSVSILK